MFSSQSSDGANWNQAKIAEHILLLPESETIHEIILEETGLDVKTTGQKNRKLEMENDVSSVASSAPDNDEMVPKSLYQTMMRSHQQELQLLREKYE